MIGRVWLQAVRMTELVSIFFTVPTNLLLLYCIFTKSPEQFGNYRHFMAFFCYQSIWFNAFSLFSSVNYYSCKHSVSAFSTSNVLNLNATGMSVLMCVAASSVCMLFSSLAAQFLYRLYAMTKSVHLQYFNHRRWLFWYAGIVCTAVLFGSNIFVFGPMLEWRRSDNFSDDIRNTFEMSDAVEIHIVRIALYEMSSSGRTRLDWSIIGYFVLAALTLIPFLVIIHCGLKIYHHFCLATSELSNHMKLQKQLFHALLIQSLFPVVFLLLPTVLFFLFPLFSLDLGVFSNIGGVTFAIYPALDPIGVIYVIRPFRSFVLGNLTCIYRKVTPQTEDPVQGERVAEVEEQEFSHLAV